MNRTPAFVICGNYGATNLGDEAILDSIIETVRTFSADSPIHVLSSNPQRTEELHKTKSVPMIPSGLRSFFRSIFSKSFRRTFQVVRKCDLVIFGGGGLFTDEKPQAILIWFFQILPAIYHRKPFMIYGQSVGPLKSGFSRRIVKYIFQRAQSITVRDRASQKILESMGIKNVQVLPDPVFGFHQSKIDAVASHLNLDEASLVSDPFVLFSLRPWLKQTPEFSATLAKFIDWIFEKYHFKSLFMPFQNFQDDDTAVMMQVVSKLEHKGAVTVLTYGEHIEKTLQVMKHAKAVVGMRLHSIIFSTLTHTPFLALSYSQKVTEVATQLGMEKFISETSHLDLHTLQQQFSELMSKHEQVSLNLKTKHIQFAKETQQYGDILKTLL